jgi:hypothetical protein
MAQNFPMQLTIPKKLHELIKYARHKQVILLIINACVAVTAQAQTKQQLLKQYTSLQQQPGYMSQHATVDLLNNLSGKFLYDNPDSAMLLADNALAAADAQQYALGRERATANIGKAYYVKGSYDSALAFSARALRLSEQLKDSTGIAGALNNVGLIYLAHEQIPAAIQQFNNALVMATRVRNNPMITADLFDLGICYDEAKKLDSAELYLQKAIETDKLNDDHHLTVMAYNRMGKTLYLGNRHEEAIGWYKKVLDYTAYRDNWELAFAYGGLAETSYELEDFKAAINYGLQSFNYAKQMNAKWDAEQALKTLAKSYAAAGDYKNAYRYQVLDGVYNDSLNNDARQQVVSYLKLQQKEAANNALKNENKLAQQQIHLTHVYNISISIFAVLLVGLTILLYRNNKTKEALNKQLVEKNKNIEHLNIMKDQLFAVVSHDLRGPMGSLQQTLQLVIELV